MGRIHLVGTNRSRAVALLAAAALALASASGCTRSEEETKSPEVEVPRMGSPGGGVGQAPEEAHPPTPAAPQPDDVAPPPSAPPAASVDVEQGAQLYATYCASCHGPRGAGDGPAAAALDPKPAKHSDGAYMNALSNEHLFKVIELGGPAVGKSALMAPWGGTLSDAQIWDVVAFVRSLAQPPYQGTVP